MKLAYQTITWGGVVGHPAGVTSVKDLYYMAHGSTEEALRDISDAGYEGVELFEGNIMEYASREGQLRQSLESLRLELVAVYSGANFIYPEILPEELGKIESVARLAGNLGASYMVFGGGAVRSTGILDQDYRLLAEGLDRAKRIVEEGGMSASYHPHLGSCVESPEQIAKLAEHTGIDFCPDTGHLAGGGGDPAEFVRTYADRIRYVHLKDYAGGGFLPLGQGELDLPQILRSLKEIEYDGWITVELDEYAGHPREGAQISREFLEKRW